MAHVLIGEPASTPDQVRGRLSPGHALSIAGYDRDDLDDRAGRDGEQAGQESEIHPQRVAEQRQEDQQTEQADIETWSWPTARFDVVVSIFTQFSPPDVRPRVFAGMKQALKPGGLLLMQAYRPEQLKYGTGGPKEVERLYTRALLESAFGDFAALDIREHDDLVQEGTGHAGMSALIDLVGTK